MRATTEIIVSHTDHVLSVCATVMLKYSFTSQNPPSLTWEKISEPAPVAIASSSGCTPVACNRKRRHNARCGSHGNGGRTGGQPHGRCQKPRHQNQRNVSPQHRGDNCLCDAAILQNAAKSASRAHQQRNGSGGGKTLVAEAQDGFTGKPPHPSKRIKAEQHSDQQGNVVIADQMEDRVGLRGAGE